MEGRAREPTMSDVANSTTRSDRAVMQWSEIHSKTCRFLPPLAGELEPRDVDEMNKSPPKPQRELPIVNRVSWR